ncbi:MAG: MarR family winged helix-turn-helix transcriptional regulator [Acidobacteriota bacterium]
MTDTPSALQREIQQNKPFRSSQQEAIIGLVRTTDIIRRRITELLAPAGITQQQYNVLRILRGAGEGGLPTLAIAERMVERTPGITRLIDRLVTKGWVIRERADEDRRRVDCRITAAGLELLAGLDPVIATADSELLEVLGEDQLRTLIGLLDAIRAHQARPAHAPS